jgi:hypothetical protein
MDSDRWLNVLIIGGAFLALSWVVVVMFMK